MAKIPEELTSRAKPHETAPLSPYDERPGYPKNSPQGYLFRNQAPAMSPQQRYPKRYTPEGDELPEMYHGTVARLVPGQVVEPGHPSTRGESGHTALGAAKAGSSQHVYATSDPAEAYRYAQEAAQKSGGEPRVYHVGMDARHVERDPEYARTKWETAEGERQQPYHLNDPTNPSHPQAEEDDPDYPAPYDPNGNFVAHRTKKPMHVKRDVTASAREIHDERHADDYGDNW